MIKTFTGKKVLVSFGIELLEWMDRIAAREEKTRSELIREATREYLQKAEGKIHANTEYTFSKE